MRRSVERTSAFGSSFSPSFFSLGGLFPSSVPEPAIPKAIKTLIALFASAPSRYILRDFTYDESAILKQKKDFELAGVEERELWVPPSFSIFLFSRLDASN